MVLLDTNRYLLVMATGLFCPGKSREGPGAGRDRTEPRDLEGPVVLPGQDLETLKVPGPLKKVPGPSGSLGPVLPGPRDLQGL